MEILLAGVVGSTAYGLAHPGSDVDRLGVFAAPTETLHGLRAPRESHVTTNPDSTLHEARKFALLALAGNPTASELLWLTGYEHTTPLGRELVDLRAAFLSAARVRDAYLGYAEQQVRKLAAHTVDPGRRDGVAKHARHVYRLCAQGHELYTTGVLTIRLADPDRFREFGEQVADGDTAGARRMLTHYQDRFTADRTVLPDRPDEPAVEDWLRRVRRTHWTGG